MFRPIKCNKRGLVRYYVRILNTAGTPSLTIGGKFFTITDLGTGNYRLDFKDPYKPSKIMGIKAIPINDTVTLAHADLAAGVLQDSPPEVEVLFSNTSAAEDNSGFVEITAASPAPLEGRHDDFILSPQRSVREIHFECDGAQLVDGSGELTFTDNGTGDYTVTPKRDGVTLLGAFAQSIKGSEAVITCGTGSDETAVNFLTFTQAGSAADRAFYGKIVLQDASVQE